MAENSPLVLGIDQSTQGTKALLLDEQGHLIAKAALPHRQIINEQGYVEHDLNEIASNVLAVVKQLLLSEPSYCSRVKCVGLSVQRETVGVWRKSSGEPLYNAIVWQCGRGAEFVAQAQVQEQKDYIRKVTGLELSEFFSAAKLTWLFDNVPLVAQAASEHDLCAGNIDTFLVDLLTRTNHCTEANQQEVGHKVSFFTEPSNASRTQLFDIAQQKWDHKLCQLFHIPVDVLPEIMDSDSLLGVTDFAGLLEKPIPIHAAIGDSQGALFGQGCLKPGQTKTTYGTGSSIMMNAGDHTVKCRKGVVNSIGWRRSGKVTYVLEGNINYSAGVISYLKDDLQLISSPQETESLARAANPQDKCYFVPALSGLGAPYFDSKARGTIIGMSRLTTKKELVRAALDSIAYQVSDVIEVVRQSSIDSSGIDISELNVDGGATGNGYLMQMQSDLINLPVKVPQDSELSGMGVAFMAGIAAGIYKADIMQHKQAAKSYEPHMSSAERQSKLEGWHQAVACARAQF